MNPKKTKLTKPQERFLRELAAKPGRTCWDEYPPLVNLVKLGMARITPGTFSARAFVTDTGREWLESHKDKP